MMMVLKLTRGRNIGIRVGLEENDFLNTHRCLWDNQVKICSRQMD